MPKPSAVNELDDAVDAIMADPAAQPRVSAGLDTLLRIAADLRDLPRAEFKARLEAQLDEAARRTSMENETVGAGVSPAPASVSASAARPPAPPLVAHDLRAALRATPELTISASTTASQADEAFRRLASFNESTLLVGRFTGRSPWERHRGGDELLYVLDGEADVTVLTDDGPVRAVARAGSIFICPKGLWHRLNAPNGVTAFYATPQPTDVSFAEDPRR